jgi:hypothetical protein
MTDLLDASAALGDFLAANSALNTLTGGRLYADSDFPPPDYSPSAGGALCWKPRQSVDPFSTEENSGIYVVNFQLASFGADRSGAAAVDRAVFAALDGKGGAVMRFAKMDGPGSPLLTPVTAWPVVLTFYTCKFANS